MKKNEVFKQDYIKIEDVLNLVIFENEILKRTRVLESRKKNV